MRLANVEEIEAHLAKWGRVLVKTSRTNTR